jgi:CelD/BcsL family acetyltransferase involved in cellulose biosynthesis
MMLAAGEVTRDDVRAWEALADRAAEPNPFLRPEFVLAARLAQPENIELFVVRAGSAWLACLPVLRAPRWRHVLLPTLGPWLDPYALFGAPLLDGEQLAAAAAGLVAMFGRERRASAVVLDRVDPTGAATKAVMTATERAGRPGRVYYEYERAQLCRRPENTYLAEAVSKTGRKRLRLKAKALERELGSTKLVDRGDDPDAVEAFLSLEASGWKGEAGTAIACRDDDTAFFRSMCAAMAAAGRLQLLALEGGGRTVAMQCNFVERDYLYTFKTAYDETYRRLSPGVALDLELLDHFHHAMTVTAMDSCAAPDSPLVNRIWADRRPIQQIVVPTGAWSGRLVRPLVSANTMARTWRERNRAGATVRADAGEDEVAERFVGPA